MEEKSLSDSDICSIAINKINSAISLFKKKDCTPRTKNLQTIQSENGILSPPKHLSGFCEFAERVVGWIALNPNDLCRVKALVSVYHLPGYESYSHEMSSLENPHPITFKYLDRDVQFSSCYNLPTKNGFLTLFDCLIKKENQILNISGRRGSGKTFAINFFLATAHRILSSKGIIWFRTDVSKLWQYEEGFLTLTQYSIFHSIYVALRYSNEDLNLSALRNNGEMFSSYLNDISQQQLGIKKVFNAWRRIVESFVTIQRKSLFDPTAKPVSYFLREGKQILKEFEEYVIENVYTEMLHFLRKSAHEKDLNLRIVVIFDGIDNIRVDAEPERYMRILNDIHVLCRQNPLKIGDTFIIVARPETFKDIVKINAPKGHGDITPKEFMLNYDLIRDLLNKKSAIIEQPDEYFQALAESYTGNKFIDTEESRDFKSSISYLLRYFRSVAMYSSNEQKQKPIDLIFDGNIRSLLRNVIRAHNYKISLAGTNVFPNRALLEGSILAGCDHMLKNIEEHVNGRWCPNLFECASVEKDQWTGLMMIRIIQLLDFVRDGVEKIKVIEFLNRNFGYPKYEIETAFQTALEYSLIFCIRHDITEFDNRIARPEKTRLYSVTKKGLYVKYLAFNDYATFYFMAAVTPLDLESLKNIGINIGLFTHSTEYERHFYRAAILSGMVLWAYIITASRNELRAYREGDEKHINQAKLIPVEAFYLPSIL